MSGQIKESDWKVFRDVRAAALERFCERVIAESRRIGDDSNRSFHERYSGIFKLIEKRDRELAYAFDNPRRSTAFQQIALIYSSKLVTDDEFGRFSPELQGQIKALQEFFQKGR